MTRSLKTVHLINTLKCYDDSIKHDFVDKPGAESKDVFGVSSIGSLKARYEHQLRSQKYGGSY